MGHYKHPSVPGATRKDLKYWRKRAQRLSPDDITLVDVVKAFYLNTLNIFRKGPKAVKWPWFDRS